MSKLTKREQQREQQYPQDPLIGDDPVPRHLRHRQICLTRQRLLRRLARAEELRAFVSTNAETEFDFDQELYSMWSEMNLVDYLDWKAERDAANAEQAARDQAAALIDFDIEDEILDDEPTTRPDHRDYLLAVDHDEAELRLHDLSEYCCGGYSIIDPSLTDQADGTTDLLDAALIASTTDEEEEFPEDDEDKLLRRHRKLAFMG